MNSKHAKPSARPPVKPSVQVVLERPIRLDDVFKEVNRLRGRDGLEEEGQLSLATTVWRHFHSSHNPRVEEALRNTGHEWCCENPEKDGPKSAVASGKTAPAKV